MPVKEEYQIRKMLKKIGMCIKRSSNMTCITNLKIAQKSLEWTLKNE